MLIAVIVALGGAVVDQLIKLLVVNTMELYEGIEIIKNFFTIYYCTNDGAAFSLFAGQRVMFLILPPVVFALVLYIIKALKLPKGACVLCGAFLGGALGNFIDRIFRVEVVDYLRFDFGSYMFPVFNFADICIVVGAILLSVYVLFFHKEETE